MKYKVGQKVRIKSLDWYNKNKDNYGAIYAGSGFCFWKNMARHCGEIMKITIVKIDPEDSNKGYYFMENSEERWTDEMIEGLVEEEVFIKANDIYNEEYSKGEYCHEQSFKWGFQEGYNYPHEKEKLEISLKEGYIFKDENGDVINATKIVLKKLVVPKFKKGDKIKDKNNRVWYVVQVGNRHFDISRIPNPKGEGTGYFVPMEDQDDYELLPDKELPKTYEECCDTLSVCSSEHASLVAAQLDLPMNTFIRLLVARNAYWKIAGEEMGLGKPWEPGDNKVFGIIRQNGKIQKYHDFVGGSTILEFPTEEMRDTFYENFKELIEICKELL